MEPRYRLLDHFRGLAALSVTLFHAYSPWLGANPNLLPGPVSTLVRHGWLGVELFFVISGYCITSLLVRAQLQQRSPGNFIADRACRLLPPYWAALLLMLVLQTAALPFNHASLAGGVASWTTALVLLEPLAGQPRVMLVSWSLAYEFAFYLIAAGCWFVSRETRRPWIAFAIGGFLAAIQLVRGLEHLGPLTYWPHFALGGVAWLLIHRLPRWPGTVLALIAGGTCWLGARLFAPGQQLPWLTSATFSVLLVLLAPLDSAVARWLPLRPLSSLGTISYSLYLVHVPVVSPLGNLARRWWPADSPPAALIPLFTSAIAICVAWAFYSQVETRSELVRRRLFSHQPAKP
jgi:exopolysaccharide production protein ExoZ